MLKCVTLGLGDGVYGIRNGITYANYKQDQDVDLWEIVIE